MKTSQINVQRLSHRLSRDPGLTITRFFFPGGPGRARSIVERVMRLDATTASRMLTMCIRDFGDHFVNLLEILETHFERAIEQIDDLDGDVTSDKRHLIGAYFTMEYAYASAALFNPSMVPALDQSGLPDGAVRFVMSLRAVGEGHISSIIFRRGIIGSDGQVSL
ncbi:MAG: glycosidase, partial [Planctomycetota bacterium]|nr:glycosidase [Planctomycetota bacterium]